MGLLDFITGDDDKKGKKKKDDKNDANNQEGLNQQPQNLQGGIPFVGATPNNQITNDSIQNDQPLNQFNGEAQPDANLNNNQLSGPTPSGLDQDSSLALSQPQEVNQFANTPLGEDLGIQNTITDYQPPANVNNQTIDDNISIPQPDLSQFAVPQIDTQPQINQDINGPQEQNATNEINQGIGENVIGSLPNPNPVAQTPQDVVPNTDFSVGTNLNEENNVNVEQTQVNGNIPGEVSIGTYDVENNTVDQTDAVQADLNISPTAEASQVELQPEQQDLAVDQVNQDFQVGTNAQPESAQSLEGTVTNEVVEPSLDSENIASDDNLNSHQVEESLNQDVSNLQENKPTQFDPASLDVSSLNIPNLSIDANNVPQYGAQNESATDNSGLDEKEVKNTEINSEVRQIEKAPVSKTEIKKVFNKVGLLGLDGSSNESIDLESIKKLTRHLLNQNFEITIDSKNGLGKFALEAASEMNKKISGAYLKSMYFSAESMDSTEQVKNMNTSFVYSNYFERMRHLVKESRIFVMIDNSSIENHALLLTLISLTKLYNEHAKPVILYGANWNAKVDALKGNQVLADTDLANVKFANNPDEVVNIANEMNSQFAQVDSILMDRVVDRRVEGDEKDFIVY